MRTLLKLFPAFRWPERFWTRRAIAGMLVLSFGMPTWAQRPLYEKPSVTPVAPDYSGAEIDISHIPPATNSATAAASLDARTAAAVYKAGQSSLITHGDDGDSISGTTVLAKWAYADYFTDGQGTAKRQEVTDLLRSAKPGFAGTTEGNSMEREYDFLMHFYIPMVYRYYDELADPQFGGSINLRDHVIDDLLAGPVRSGIPSGRYVAGRADAHEFEYYHYTVDGPLGVGSVTIFDVPETENHLLGINAARYLVNQLIYARRGYDSLYDNNRNGDSDKSIEPTTQFLLEMLGTVPDHPGFLSQDFAEYNARNYQDDTLSALLNLATYAYDSRVKMAARMVLDYVSAKIAVSSCDLRRAPPFRRRNELKHYGPIRPGGALGSPLLASTPDAEPDPQSAFYALLAGNTSLFAGTVPGNDDEEMVHAGICEYRVPSPILDLFTNPKDREFYQSFRHNAGDGVNANELYYGSRSYLLSAGGNPTGFCYKFEPNVGVELFIHYLGLIAGAPFPIQAILGALELDSNIRGLSADMGSAMPTILIPAGEGTSLDSMVQIGKYAAGGDEEEHAHLGVAPDFICGRDLYVPNGMTGISIGNWLFVDRGHSGEERPGYYLAINSTVVEGVSYGFVEAYDTWLHSGLSFGQFKTSVLARYGTGGGFDAGSEHNYTTQSGYTIKFKIDLDGDNAYAEIVQSPGKITQPDRSKYLSGTILNSEESDGKVLKISIMNPAYGGRPIVLDLSDPAHGPVRVSETGVVEATGVPYEVWVNPNAPTGLAEVGDFGAPFRTLSAASKVVAPGGMIKIVPGTIKDSVKITTPMILKSFPGGAVIGK